MLSSGTSGVQSKIFLDKNNAFKQKIIELGYSINDNVIEEAFEKEMKELGYL